MPALLPRIALDRINLHLAGRHILRDVSWSLRADEHWAVIGPNGSGKSSLLRVIAGIQWIDYDGGTRRYSSDGTQPESVARATSWIRHVSAEQHEHYARLDLPLSGRAIIESGLDNSVYVQRALDPSAAARVDELIDRLDLDRFVRRPLREVSSGQFRRLLIARALVSEPSVLVLDEFTSGLDRAARHEVLAFLDRIAPTVALIVASHRTDDFPAAVSHTVSVQEGSIVQAVSGRPLRARTARPLREAPSAAADEASLIRIRHADVYRGETLVLRDVNWELRRGEHNMIRGANGAGKSTFAGLLAGTLAAATGAEIIRFGKTAPFDVWQLKARIAHLSDDLQIGYDYSETVEAVIASGFSSSIGLFVKPTDAQWTAVDDLVGQIGIDSLRNRLFHELSFGERRKVLIARSLVHRPAIMILDEIWNGLDVAFRSKFGALLTTLTQAGTTLVAIAHDDEADDSAELVSRFFSIENGTIFEERQSSVATCAAPQGAVQARASS